MVHPLCTQFDIPHGLTQLGRFVDAVRPEIDPLGAALPVFKLEIVALVVFLLCVVLGPLLVFAPQLAQTKRTGIREYGAGPAVRARI